MTERHRDEYPDDMQGVGDALSLFNDDGSLKDFDQIIREKLDMTDETPPPHEQHTHSDDIEPDAAHDEPLKKGKLITADIASVADDAKARIGPSDALPDEPLSRLLQDMIFATGVAAVSLVESKRAHQHVAIFLWDDPKPDAPKEVVISYAGQPGFEDVLPKIIDRLRPPEKSYMVVERHDEGLPSMRVVKSREPFPATSNTMVFEMGDRPITVPVNGTWGQYYRWQNHGGEWVPTT